MMIDELILLLSLIECFTDEAEMIRISIVIIIFIYFIVYALIGCFIVKELVSFHEVVTFIHVLLLNAMISLIVAVMILCYFVCYFVYYIKKSYFYLYYYNYSYSMMFLYYSRM